MTIFYGSVNLIWGFLFLFITF